MNDVYYTMYRCNLGSFVDLAFRELHPGEMMMDNWHIRMIADLLQGPWISPDLEFPRKLIFNLPPGYLKTHICSVSFPAWVLGRDPRRSILIVSETNETALEIRERCVELMRSKLYKWLFPRARISKVGRNVEFSYGGRIRHMGIGYTLPRRSSDLVIIDNPQSLQSLKRLDLESYADIGATLHDPKQGMILVVTRRLGKTDFSAYLRSLRGWGCMKLPVVSTRDTEWPGIHHDGFIHRRGAPLHYWYEGWPEIEEHIRNLGGEAFRWQYMQGLYTPPAIGQRTITINGEEMLANGTFDPTWVTFEDFKLLKQEFQSKYDPMTIDLSGFQRTVENSE